MAQDIQAFILAGGKSSRFGSDKALAAHRGATLLARSVKLLRAMGFVPRVVCREPGPYLEMAPAFVVSEAPDLGPAEGLRAVLQACSAPRALVLAVDMPGVTRECLQQLLDIPSGAACFQAAERLHPFPGLYPASLLSTIAPWPRSMHALLESAEAKTLTPQNPGWLKNVNQPGDLE